MAEERIAERIDANILNWPVHNLRNLSSDEWESKFKRLTKKTKGKLIIKEYPTASASVLHFRALLNELKLKKNFKPQVIFIDYLNICCSSRMGMGSGSYSYIKAIAEELRGLAVEENVPLFSATQINRAGYGSSDPGMEDTSESFGLPATCDFMFAIVTNEELPKKMKTADDWVKQTTKNIEEVIHPTDRWVGYLMTEADIHSLVCRVQADALSSRQLPNCVPEGFLYCTNATRR